MASLDDILTTQKNGVVTLGDLVNELASFRELYLSGIGGNASIGITAPTLISSEAGRLVNLYVIDGGSSGGFIHDASSVAAASTLNALTTIPTTAGITSVNIPFSNGLVVIPGTGQSINITYS
jgi:hypothetical protein